MSQTAAALSQDAQTEICTALNQCVAETVVTTMLAQNFHWNVTGMAFGPLHELFQQVYEDHFVAQDDLAERIKALGGHANGKLADMVAASKVPEHDGHADDKTMIAALADAQRTVAGTLAGAADIAEKHGDMLTQDLCIERGRTHEKFAWLISAHLR
ncbi:Dps family protein [uncultured Tateyamaria sp.]|uniref:Dps family protein n=1 Tax=uncultured Tateyamaria sp. TaxID=455651 RepID=UPI00261A3E96|nr:DNA starvation/stationary phase protection protein [uncultured Tateyamaria sp.]